MSFNRLMYDTCQTTREQNASVSILDYVMAPFRYENPHKARHTLGLVGGPAVSHIQGNLVDLESELRGQTRYQTMCARRHYQPSTDGMIRNDKTAPIDTRRVHLPSCQMFPYRSVPLPEAMKMSVCRH